VTPGTYASVNANHDAHLDLHAEITCRAYELYEQGDTIGDHNLRGILQAEAHRLAYAAAELERCVNGEPVDGRTVTAALVYLRALGSFMGEHDGDGAAATEQNPR
jgi:hypothetical protein